MAKTTPAPKKAMTKSEIYGSISESTDLTKKQVSAVFDALTGLIEKNIKPRSPQQFTLPGLCKIVVKKKPATKARKGVNPFTGEEMMFKAKPASNIIKIRPLKALKDMA